MKLTKEQRADARDHELWVIDNPELAAHEIVGLRDLLIRAEQTIANASLYGKSLFNSPIHKALKDGIAALDLAPKE